MGLFGKSTFSKQRDLINEGYNKNNNLIQAERNSNPLQKAYAQEAINAMTRMLRDSQKQAAATAAVAGGSSEYAAAQKQAAAQQLGNLMGNISAQASQNDMAMLQADINNKNQQTSQLTNARAQQAQRSAALSGAIIGGLSSVGAQAAGAYLKK